MVLVKNSKLTGTTALYPLKRLYTQLPAFNVFPHRLHSYVSVSSLFSLVMHRPAASPAHPGPWARRPGYSAIWWLTAAFTAQADCGDSPVLPRVPLLAERPTQNAFAKHDPNLRILRANIRPARVRAGPTHPPNTFAPAPALRQGHVITHEGSEAQLVACNVSSADAPCDVQPRAGRCAVAARRGV
ncbi:hypothetical protein VTO73DRAFT_10913 [Trametes versicolor]